MAIFVELNAYSDSNITKSQMHVLLLRDAAPELKDAEEYRNKAIAVNDAGYPRFAELLRSISKRYEDDARRIRGDHGTDDSP